AAAQSCGLEVEEYKRRPSRRAAGIEARLARPGIEAFGERADRLAPVPRGRRKAALDDEDVSAPLAAQFRQRGGIRDSRFAIRGEWRCGRREDTGIPIRVVSRAGTS